MNVALNFLLVVVRKSRVILLYFRLLLYMSFQSWLEQRVFDIKFILCVIWYPVYLCLSVCQSCCNYYKLTENYMQVLIWRNYHCFIPGDPPERNRDENAVFSLNKHGGGRANSYHHTSTHHHCVSSCNSLFIETKCCDIITQWHIVLWSSTQNASIWITAYLKQ